MNFRLLNIPVHIHPTFWIFLLFFTNILRHPTFESIIVGAVMFFSLLVHEFGHALTALYFGARPQIILEAFGGRAEYSGARLTHKQHFFITLNGPLLESTLIFLSYSLLKSGIFEHAPYIQYFLQVTMRLNILWCLLNLIPIAPLDGGQLVRYALEQKFGYKGYRTSLIIGLVAAAIFIPILFLKGLPFFSALLLLMGLQTFQLLKQDLHTMSDKNQFNTYLKGVEALRENNLDQAKALLTKLLKSKDPKIKHLSAESIAKIYHTQNQPEKSYNLLLSLDPTLLTHSKPLLCKLAFDHHNYPLVTQHAHDNYTLAPSLETALMNSKAFAHLNDPDLSTAWLTTATQFGPEFHAHIREQLADAAYDTVRDSDAFKSVVEKL